MKPRDVVYQTLRREQPDVCPYYIWIDPAMVGPLARHYGIAGVRGPHMRRVAVHEVRHQVPGMAADEGGLGLLRHADAVETIAQGAVR